MGRFVIVGNGVTGVRAAEVLRRHLDDADITLVSEEPYPFYRRPQLADFAAGVIGESRLWGRRKDFYDEQRLAVRLGARSHSIDTDGRTLTLDDGAVVPYDSLLVATGRHVASAEIDGGDLGGVIGFKTLDDARAVRDLDGAGKSAVVWGDGLVALELVRALTLAGFTTTYVVPGARLWPAVMDDEAADIFADRIRAAGAELVMGAEALSVVGEGGRATGLRLSDGRVVSAELIGVCAEYRPALDFLPEAGLGFKVGTGFSTQWPGIYAAGDVTQDLTKQYFNWLRSWRQGAAAGTVMAGGEAEVQEDVDLLNTAPLGLSLVAIGRTVVAYRSGYSEMRGDYPYGEFYKKLVFDPEGALVGAILVGSVAEAGALEAAIRLRTRKEDLDPALVHQMFERTYRTAYQGVQCPVCRHEIQLARAARAGDSITCPVCGVDLTLAEGDVGFVAKAAK
jgi:nitrite reductase (NADH) large subunit